MKISAYAVPGLKPVAEFNMDEHIMDSVCMFMKITREQLKSRCRKRQFVYPRHLCMYFMRKYTRLTTGQVALLLGDLDHSSICHGREVIVRLLQVDRSVQSDINHLIKILSNETEITHTPGETQKDCFPVRSDEGAVY